MRSESGGQVSRMERQEREELSVGRKVLNALGGAFWCLFLGAFVAFAIGMVLVPPVETPPDRFAERIDVYLREPVGEPEGRLHQGHVVLVDVDAKRVV